MKNLLFSCLSLLHFTLILVCLNAPILVTCQCLEDQRSLLLQLKTSLVNNPSRSSKLATWDRTSDCCQWKGVQCDSSTGHVIGLDLSSESITGGIDNNSSSLFKLHYLQSLNMANNRFNDAHIPAGLGSLSELTYLNLSKAGCSGQVPLDISHLHNLETIDLSTSPLLETFPLKLENPSFDVLIRNLSNIRGLYLDGVAISAHGSEWCKALSSSLPNLQVLSLSNCNLSGEIHPSLKSLHSLSVIHLDQNRFDGSVPGFIAEYRNLTLLKLSYCMLKGVFPSKILKIPTLESIDLSDNEQLQGTLPEFPVNSSLRSLVLTVTNFSGQLPNYIGRLTKLRTIDLGNCSFSGAIPDSMTNLHQLEHLDLSNNNFSGPMPVFSSVKNLMVLDLHRNSLSGTLSSTLWAGLAKLVSLDLSFNSLSGKIPASLLNLPSLLSIKLSQNELSGQLPEFNGPSLRIQTLDLSSNTLGGLLPKSLFTLQGLEVLDISFNRLNGSLDLNMIQQLKNLSNLDLSFNSLSVYESSTNTDFMTFPQLSTLVLGSSNLHAMPTFLKNQTRLLYLDLSNNQLQGNIPRWIWGVGNGYLQFLNLSCNSFTGLEVNSSAAPSLQVLDLHSNNLHGEIPKLTLKASYLDFSNNSFTLVIPSNLANFLNFTTVFSLSRNNIAGSIPTFFCTQVNLQVLDMSYNRFDRNIPDCLIKMTSQLAVLNLKGNMLSGKVPDKFPRSCNLRTLDVNVNHPAWLSTPQLRILILRSNNFTGSIPCASSGTMWPVLQIIDLAFNDFDGELQADCFQSWKAMVADAGKMQPETSLLQYNFLQKQYYEMASVAFKGSVYNLTKISNIFNIMDLSSNNLHGQIPEAIGNLNALVSLNLSRNHFSGSIPSSLGNLTMLESLDLSENNLTGNIPTQLANLNFLEYLNLSCNGLVGQIPAGTQLQSFDKSSYADNRGLCDPPLFNKCSNSPASSSVVQPTSETSHSAEFDWQYILIGTGFGIGAGLSIAPLMFSKKWRKWQDEQVDKFASTICQALGISCSSFDEGRVGCEDGIGHQLCEISDNFEDEDEDDETEDESDNGRFCVFCSKLDVHRRRVIHDPGCTCSLPSIPSST